jgi:hypothetical protein
MPLSSKLPLLLSSQDHLPNPHLLGVLTTEKDSDFRLCYSRLSFTTEYLVNRSIQKFPERRKF